MSGEESCDSEIHDLDTALGIHHEVLGFEVAVRDALSVSLTQPAADLAQNVDRASYAEYTESIQQRANRFPFDVLHRYAWTFADVAELVNAADVLMRDFPRDFEFVLEALHHELVVHHFGPQNFNRDK